MPVRTTNISQGGFVCLTSAALEVGNLLRVRLQFTPHDSLDCKAQVVWVEEPVDPPPGRWALVAFRFVDLADAKQHQIDEALVALGSDVDGAGVPQAYRSGQTTPAR